MIKLTALILIVVLIAVSISIVSAGSYNLKRALDGVYYSKIAYCSMNDVATWSCDACPKFPGVTNITTAQVELDASSAYVAYNPQQNQIIYAFRGTVDLQGWIEDFDFFQTQYDPSSGCGSNCMVHQGLYWGYLELAKTLTPAIQQLVAAYPTADIAVHGHSMGAAQSGFAQVDMIRMFGNNSNGFKGTIRTYNFGEPRIGNPAFVKWQQTVLRETESFRVTNYGDPVPHLPPVVFDQLDLGKWIHNPREVFYQNNFGSPADYKVCQGNYTYEDKTCADSTPIWSFSFKKHTTYLDIGLGCFL